MSEPQQQILLSECPTCSWWTGGFCAGPRDLRTYLMQGDNYTACLNTAKRELLISDTFKRLRLIPEKMGAIHLPSFIPTIATSSFRIADEFEDNTFGVSLGKIIGEGGNLKYQTLDEIRQSFGVPSRARMALICTGGDAQLENLWKIHETKRIFERIAELGFAWTTSLTFSVWQEGFPRPDQLRNQYRNFSSCDVFVSLGLPCIPFLFPVEPIDFQNTAEWLIDRPFIETVAIYARFYSTEQKFQTLCAFMSRIEALVPRKIRFLVCGIGKAENIARLGKMFKCSFENSTMFQKTIHGLSCDEGLKYSRSVLSLPDIFRINLLRNEVCAEQRKSRPIIYLMKPKVTKSTTSQPSLMGLST